MMRISPSTHTFHKTNSKLFPLSGFLTADSDASEAADTYYDILMCGSCQKTFALGEIVKFIQHKVLQCNKENYGQCYTQGEFSQAVLFFSAADKHSWHGKSAEEE